MEKADSLSFPTVYGSGGRGQSLYGEILVGAKDLRLFFFFGFKVPVVIRFTKLLSKSLYCALRRALHSHDLSQKKTLRNHG